MESLLEILLEVFLQVVGDLVVEVVSRSRSPMVHAIADSLLAAGFAAILSVLSLAIHPHHAIRSSAVRLAVLLTLPVLNGFLMVAVGRKLSKRGHVRSEFERFVPAFLFSLIFGLIRFVGAK